MIVDWTVILVGAALGVLGLGLGLAWIGVRRLNAARTLLQQLQLELKQVRRESTELKPYALQLGERLTALERRLKHLGDRQVQVESRSRSGPDYERAIRMAKAGAHPDEVMRQCGMGKSEARLIIAIHGPREA